MGDLQIGVRFPVGKRMFFFPKTTSLGLIPTQHLTQLVMEIRQLASKGAGTKMTSFPLTFQRMDLNFHQRTPS
jgi:hypothetical protein